MMFSLLKWPLPAFGVHAEPQALRKTEAMTSLVYEVQGTSLCFEFESVVLLWSIVVKLNANFWFYFSCTGSNQMPETTPYLLLGAQDQRLVASQN